MRAAGPVLTLIDAHRAGVAMSAIIEGNFDKQDNRKLTLMFATFEALALSLLFLCLVCCLLVSRRMSIYMIQRAAHFVDRCAARATLTLRTRVCTVTRAVCCR